MLPKTNKKIVSLIGIENLCIIEDDDVIVIANRNDIEQVKNLQNKLKNLSLIKLL